MHGFGAGGRGISPKALLDEFKGRATSPFFDGVVRGAPKAPISSSKTAIRF